MGLFRYPFNNINNLILRFLGCIMIEAKIKKVQLSCYPCKDIKYLLGMQGTIVSCANVFSQ